MQVLPILEHSVVLDVLLLKKSVLLPEVSSFLHRSFNVVDVVDHKVTLILGKCTFFLNSFVLIVDLFCLRLLILEKLNF